MEVMFFPNVVRLTKAFVSVVLLVAVQGFASLAQDLPTKDSRADYKLKGPAKLLTFKLFNGEMSEDTFKIFEQINAGSWPTELTFNEAGHRLKRAKCNMYGEECIVKTNIYKADDLVESNTVEEDGQMWLRDTYEYFPNGSLRIKRTFIREIEGLMLSDSSVYSNDSVGRTIVARYENNGELAGGNRYTIGKHGTIYSEELDAKGNVEKRKSWTYDDRGNVTSISDEGRGILMRKTDYTFLQDSLETETQYALGPDGLALRYSKKIVRDDHGEVSVFKTDLIDSIALDSYHWIISDSAGNVTYEQKCKSDQLQTERWKEWNAAGDQTNSRLYDHVNTRSESTNFHYNESDQLVEETTESSDGSTAKFRYYYDAYGNWTHVAEHRVSDSDLEYCHIHVRKIEYYDEH